MMKKICAFVMAVVAIFSLVACSAPQSADIGKEMEQFGFVFTIPQGVTGNQLDDGIYDIDFGVTGKREAFIGINPPEDITEIGEGEEELLQLLLQDMQQVTTNYFENISNEVVETRSLDGNPAGYIGMDCTISNVPVYWQMYMVILDNTLYSFTIQIYTNKVQPNTLETIDTFVEEIQLKATAAA
ncbi:hypothetical protein LJC61_03070 [Ruminococcaceae bacterium OttesenSCG-928-A16]|nr:hypothetical protein [Ruminococcaceae bacterium OttesenSCG-928-A16]